MINDQATRIPDWLVLGPWRTNGRLTRSPVATLPARIWSEVIPGGGRRTVRSLAARLLGARLPVSVTNGLWWWQR